MAVEKGDGDGSSSSCVQDDNDKKLAPSRRQEEEEKEDDVVRSSIPLLGQNENDNHLLLRYGVCRVRLPNALDCNNWAEKLSKVPLSAMTMEGDEELPLYQNIMEDEEFPFEAMLVNYDEEEDDDDNDKTTATRVLPSIAQAFRRHFDVSDPLSQLRLDDAFGVHYQAKQHDTTGAKHQDPSDITLNICLHKSEDTIMGGSHVLFHGVKQLQNVRGEGSEEEDYTTTTLPSTFLVEQIPGTATLHYGDHVHETTKLLVVKEEGNNTTTSSYSYGSRTNVILTYWYADGRPSNVATRSCYTTT